MGEGTAGVGTSSVDRAVGRQAAARGVQVPSTPSIGRILARWVSRWASYAGRAAPEADVGPGSRTARGSGP